MAVTHIPGKRYQSGYSPEFAVTDAVQLFWERQDFGVYIVGVLIKDAFYFDRLKAVTNDFGDLVQVD